MTRANDYPTTSGQLKVALAQYRELRAEIAQCLQAQRALLGLALTAAAAIGSYGFGASSRLEVLLVLPFVLSGLALIYLHYAVQVSTIGTYIQIKLWPFLGAVSPSASGVNEPKLPSWEEWVARHRNQRGRLSPEGLVTFLGQGIVFGVPAAGALALTRHLAWAHDLVWVWSLGAAVVVVAAAMVVIVNLCVLSPEDRARAAAWRGERV
jgi:hypothetical protein